MSIKGVPASDGRLVLKPNLKPVKNILKKFFAGFQRITGTEISDESRKDVYIVKFSEGDTF
jgi:hypothetical protein